MKISFPIQYTFLDYPDNFSLALSVYVYGCRHECAGCHSPELSNADFGNYITYKRLNELIEPLAKKGNTKKLVFMGGDPFFKENFEDINMFIDSYGEMYDICIYTGYDLKYLIKKNISNKFQFLKCGKFMQEYYQMPYKDDEKIVFASKNQILYNNNFKELSIDGIYYFK